MLDPQGAVLVGWHLEDSQTFKINFVLLGRNHPKYPKEDYFESTPPTTPELKRTRAPLNASKEQDELRKDLKFSQQR